MNDECRDHVPSSSGIPTRELPITCGSGHRVNPPYFFSGFNVEGRDVRTHSPLAGGHSDHDLSAGYKGRHHDVVAGFVIRDLGNPDFLSCFRVNRDQKGIICGEENLILGISQGVWRDAA